MAINRRILTVWLETCNPLGHVWPHPRASSRVEGTQPGGRSQSRLHFARPPRQTGGGTARVVRRGFRQHRRSAREKPGNLLPNDVGAMGHVKPLVDRLAAVRPELLPHVVAILG